MGRGLCRGLLGRSLLSGGRFLGLALLVKFDELVFAQGNLRQRCLAVEDGVSNQRGVKTYRFHRIVIAGNNVIDVVRRTIGVDDRDHRNAQLSRLAHSDVLVIDVDHEQNIGKRSHVLDAAEAPLELVLLTIQTEDFFLGQALQSTFLCHLLQIGQPFHRLTNRLVVGEHATEPAVTDKGHLATLCLGTDRVSR